MLRWSTPGAERVLQTDLFGRLLDPAAAAVRTTTLGTFSQRVDFRAGERLVDTSEPVIRSRYRPRAQAESTRIVRVENTESSSSNTGQSTKC